METSRLATSYSSSSSLRGCFIKAGCGIFLIFSVLATNLDAQSSVERDAVEASGRWASTNAIHLFGMPELKPKLRGTLSVSPDELAFTTPAGHTTIELAKVVAISVGGERMERGGTMGKIARSAIPFGGGQALGLMTGAQVDLLTIEFRDEHEAYHGAVFLLPKDEAIHAKELFPYLAPAQVVERSQPPCLSGSVRPTTMKVSTIASTGQVLPSEYKVLLYEQLMWRLHEQAGFERIYRDGDNSAASACPELNLVLTVNAFTKGNAVLRASTGPLGMFVGATHLKFKIELRDYQKKVLLEKDLKVSQRGDNESLDIADSIAKSVAKKLKKATAHRPSA